MKNTLRFIFLLFCITTFAQQNKVDSLKNLLTHQSDREKIDTYLDISKQKVPPDTSIFYLDKALILSKKIYFDSIYPIQFAKCIANYFKGDLKNAKKEIRKALGREKFTKNPDATNGHINMLLGVLNEAENNVDSAKYFYDKVILKLKDNNSKKAIEILSSTYTNYANVFLKSGKYEKAIQIYLNSEKKSASVGDDQNRLISLNNIAGCYKEIKMYDKSINYYKEALIFANKNNDYQNLGAINLGIGEIYTLKNDYDNALVYFLKAKEILQKTEFRSVLNIAYQNLAQIYLRKDDFSKAKLYSEKATKGIGLIKDDFSKASILLTEVNILEKEKNYQKALNTVNKVIALTKKNQYQNLLKESIIEKIKILKILRKTNSLPPLYDELLTLKDSILNKENLKVISEVETKYQTEKKEKENLLLKNQATANALTITKQQQKTTALIATLSIISLLFFGSFFVFKQRQKSQKQRLIIEKLEAKENERNRLAGNVHDSLAGYLRKTMTKVDNLNKELKNPTLDQIGNSLEKAYDKARNISQEYQKLNFNKIPFKKYVTSLLFERQELYHINIDDEGLNDIDWSYVKPEIKVEFYRILQEALINISKHAKASNIIVSFTLKQKNLYMQVIDDGIGLDISQSFESVGLSNIQARIKDLNGTMNIKSQQNSGFELKVSIPV